VFALYAGSASCRDCHRQAYDRWGSSHHAQAERPLALGLDLPAFYPPRTVRHGSQTSEVRFAAQRFEILTPGEARTPVAHVAQRVIGVDPLRQYLIPWRGGRFQVTELAADPVKRDWFDIFGQEDRQPGEWGHWTGRGMTWNSMCASCHNTRVRKNYTPEKDAYSTRMAEAGVGCEACHGPMAAHVTWQRGQPQPPPTKDPTLRLLSKDQMLEACAVCHARRTELTGDFAPGDAFLDHYGLIIPDETDLYYTDGQVREEDYEYASFRGSRMFAAGVRCGDCHDPHTAKVLASDNSLCLRCHQAPLVPAPKIDPAGHSFHRQGEAGDRCVDCHMPQTVYMQRHARHDHGFTIPDPLLTRQWGVPNACNRCHKDRSADWALEWVARWYGPRMERPTRTRAQAIALGRSGQEVAIKPLLAIAREDKIGLWRAVAVGLLKHWSADREVTRALVAATSDADALVRTLAARSLEALAVAHEPSARAACARLLEDPVRSVRIEAAWALRASLDTNSPAGRDLAGHLFENLDQPSGQMQAGVFQLDRGDEPAALASFQRAVSWDAGSAPLRQALAVGLSLQGRQQEAVKELRVACRLAPREAEYHFKLGLALNESGQLEEARTELAEAVKLEPRFVQAWHNLGLADAALGRLEEALEALTRAESLDPASARLPYARATVLARLGRHDEARNAARRALELDPRFGPALELLEALGR
jgi:predicted CXXCH cytochrome family protein